MKKDHRQMLSRLMSACNNLGSSLDATATNVRKYIDRQEAHMKIYHILYGILTDSPENDYREEDMEAANKALIEIEDLVKKEYTDRNGN